MFPYKHRVNKNSNITLNDMLQNYLPDSVLYKAVNNSNTIAANIERLIGLYMYIKYRALSDDDTEVDEKRFCF